jgi:hypothetical protein
MIISTYSIAFNLQVGDSNMVVPLTADVEVHHSETHYVIKNIKAGSHRRESVLPDLKIKKVNGLWVHIDSEKESHLSRQVGNSIERLENETADP